MYQKDRNNPVQWRVLYLKWQNFEAYTTVNSLLPVFFLVTGYIVSDSLHCNTCVILAEFGYLALTEWHDEGFCIGK